MLPAGAFQFNGKTDYNMAMPLMLAKFYPPGLLGLGLTALLASFMSGMAGNVTAFNTVWTYDIYKAYLKPDGERRPLHEDGPAGHGVRHASRASATAYVAMNFGNIMDLLQLVFSFINAPLFATFLLGHVLGADDARNGAFWGLLSGTIACAAALPADRRRHRRRGRRCTRTTATWRGTSGAPSGRGRTCFVVTIAVSLVTTPRSAEDMKGLVYSLTPKIREEGLAWYLRPGRWR